MNGARNMGRLGVAMIVMIATVVLSAAPAHASTGLTRYENVGNPHWCMDGDWYGPILIYCSDDAPGQRWQWIKKETGRFAGLIQLKSTYTGKCVTGRDPDVVVNLCDDNADPQHWDVWGSNGWVVYRLAGTNLCIRPVDTEIVRGYYLLKLAGCPVPTNVPNIFAWRYFV